MIVKSLEGHRDSLQIPDEVGRLTSACGHLLYCISVSFSMESFWMQAHPTPPCISTNGRLTSKTIPASLPSTMSVM